MRQLRSIGAFMIACAMICGLIATERYNSAKTTAQAVADALPGVDFVSVGIPLATKVAGLIGVMLLVAGAKCIFESFRNPKSV